MMCPEPVRPPHSFGEDSNQDSNDLDTMLCAPCVDDEPLIGDKMSDFAGIDEDVDTDLAMLDDPIVGVERVTADKNGPGALTARALPTPPSMTPAAFMRHCLTHLPYHPGCPICAATRRPNTQHRRSHEHSRLIPLLAGDYGFVRSSMDPKEHLKTVLVLRIIPYKLICSQALLQPKVLIKRLPAGSRDSFATQA